jgi:hypothetical protein
MPGKNLSRVRGHIQNPHVGPLLHYLPANRHAISVRHHNVDDHQVDAALRQAEDVECFGAALRLENPIAFLTQETISDPP